MSSLTSPSDRRLRYAALKQLRYSANAWLMSAPRSGCASPCMSATGASRSGAASVPRLRRGMSCVRCATRSMRLLILGSARSTSLRRCWISPSPSRALAAARQKTCCAPERRCASSKRSASHRAACASLRSRRIASTSSPRATGSSRTSTIASSQGWPSSPARRAMHLPASCCTRRLGARVSAGEPLLTLHAESVGELDFARAYLDQHAELLRIGEGA